MITLDHINIKVYNQEAVCDFLVDLLGLIDGPRPDFNFPGHWLYLDDKPVIHLMQRSVESAANGWVDHIAFAGFDFDTEIKRLDDGGYVYGVGGIPGGPRQIFISGPDNVKVELQCTSS